MTISAALVGCGRMGRRHAEAIAGLPARLVAVADPVEAACKALLADRDQALAPVLFSNLGQLLERQIPDLLLIATTADAHASQALQAIEAGVGLILLEKPVVTSLRESDGLQKACMRSGARIAVNHQMRFLPQYIIPKKLLCSYAYGGFKSMHVAA